MHEEANVATSLPLKDEEQAVQPVDQTVAQLEEQSVIQPSQDGADVEAATLSLKVMRNEAWSHSSMPVRSNGM